jgi:epoxyqueuosine reductase
MGVPASLTTADIDQSLRSLGVDDWGVADVDTRWHGAPALSRAISLLVCVRPASLDGLTEGPTHAYVAEYRRLNDLLVEAGEGLVDLLGSHGCQARRVDDDAPDGPEDPPIFASKTAATQAGLGWIGKTALLVTPAHGSAVRLGTVFTDLELPAGRPTLRSRCGSCRFCVDACPVGAGKDVLWVPGTPRAALYDCEACDRHQRAYPEFDEICGICIWVCPYSRRGLRRDAVGGRATHDMSRRAP